MTLILSGTNGLSDVDGSAATPAIRGTDTNTGMFFPAADTVGITTGGTERARVDSSGNLGLGVTPSAWGSTSRALQMQSGMSLFSNTSGLGGVGNNVYSIPGTGDYYIANGFATRYYQFNGTHVWNYAASGTAGNAITFTQAMTLDASGNFMVGATSANGRARFVAAASADCILNLETSTNNYASGVVLTALNDNGAIYNYILSKTNGGTEHWKIGGVGASSALAFSTGGTERARIDSSGNLLVGTTSVFGAGGISIQPSAGAPTVDVKGSATTNGSSVFNVYSTGASAYRFYVGMGGTISATSTTITGISDRRLKENIRDLDDGLEKVMALQPRKFDWKEGKGADVKNARGFIAQEFEQVFPDLIEQWKDEPPEGEEPYKAVRADLIPTLVKAIQEQQAIITQLQADVAALKGQA